MTPTKTHSNMANTETFTITIKANVSRHDYYPDANRAGCRRCVFYTICTAISNLAEKFPYSFTELSEKPCRQNVESPDRKHIKFK